MGQSTSIRRAALLHPTVSILLIADYMHVLGTPEEIIDAIMTIRDLYAEIGLSPAATTASKNIIYGFGQHYTQLSTNLYKRLTFIEFNATSAYRMELQNAISITWWNRLTRLSMLLFLNYNLSVISMGRIKCYVPEYRLYLQ